MELPTQAGENKREKTDKVAERGDRDKKLNKKDATEEKYRNTRVLADSSE